MKSLSNVRNGESKEEQIAVFLFLVAWGTGTLEILRCISAVYVDYCILLTSVHEYYSDSTSRFSEGRLSQQQDSYPDISIFIPDVAAHTDTFLDT